MRAARWSLVMVLVVASCGIPTEDRAQVASEDEVPFGLLDRDREPVAGAQRQGRVPVEIFLASEDDDHLVPVGRRLDDPSIEAVLSQLERGPDDAESASDLSTPLAEVDAIASVEVDGGVAVVDLTEDFADISGSDQLIALAQIVFTATARPGVGQVTFTLEGESVEIPVGDGTLTRGAVSRDDYPRFRPS